MKPLQKGEIAIDTWDIVVIHDALTEWLSEHSSEHKDYDSVKELYEKLCELQYQFWNDPKAVADEAFYHD